MRLSLDVCLCLKQYMHRMKHNETVTGCRLVFEQYMHRMKHNETVTEYRLVFKAVYASNEA